MSGSRSPAVALGLILLGSSIVAGESPYAGLEGRSIKALCEQQIDDYLEGRGMGFALAAELNGYPGPKHVLELADELALDAPQLDAMRSIFELMRSDAVALGRRIVEGERALDAVFAAGTIEAVELAEAVEELGRLNGRLRGVHLAAHLETLAVLTDEQRSRYVHLRGYESGEGHDPSRHHGTGGSSR